MGLTHSECPPKNQKSSFRLKILGIYSKILVLHFGKSGLKWVAVARHGLILWENDATGSRKPSKSLRGPKYPIQKLKIPKMSKMSRKKKPEN